MTRWKAGFRSALVLVCLAGSARADDLPDAPKPKVILPEKPNHSRRIWLLETATLGALYAADFTLTARGLGEGCNTWRGCKMQESDPLYGRHPSNAQLTIITAAQFAAGSLVLRKTEKSQHKWVKWGGRAFFAYTVVGEVRGIRTWKR